MLWNAKVIQETITTWLIAEMMPLIVFFQNKKEGREKLPCEVVETVPWIFLWLVVISPKNLNYSLMSNVHCIV